MVSRLPLLPGDPVFIVMRNFPDYVGSALFIRYIDENLPTPFILKYQYLVSIEGIGRVAVSHSEIYRLNKFLVRLYNVFKA